MTESFSILVNTQMAEPHLHWSYKLVSSLPVRIGLVLLTTGLIAGISPVVFFVNRFVSPYLLRLVVVIAVGLVAGFTARQLLRGKTYLLRLSTAWLALVVDMVLLGFLTGGYAGINLVSNQTANSDWVGLGQLALGSTAVFLTLQAWKSSSQRKQKTASSVNDRSKSIARNHPAHKNLVPLKNKPVRQTKKASRLVSSQSPEFLNRRFWYEHKKHLTSKLVHWTKQINAFIEKSTHWAAELMVKSRAKLNTEKKFVRSKIRLKRFQPVSQIGLKRNNLVKLAGRTENRCPYCLEVVQKSDPRGVKICPVCHTYHHADCWAVTGICQVPHYHE